jgi:hypothetical protein
MSTAVRRAIYGKLAGDTTLNNLLAASATGYSKSIYYQVAPEGAAFPFVIFNKQSGVPTEAFGDPSALENDVWLVKAIDADTTADDAEAAAARIGFLLNDASLSISGPTLVYLRRQSDVEYSEVANGVTYRHAGSLFRLVTTD